MASIVGVFSFGGWSAMLRGWRFWTVGAVGAVVAAILAGCTAHNPVYFPALLSPGEIQPTHAKPRGRGYFEDFDPHARQLVVRPCEGTSPVKTERVLIATLYDDKGQPRRGRRIEWLLEGQGNIVEVDESGFLAGRGYKQDNKYAVSYTDYFEHCFTRGNSDPNDDFVIRPGQSWCVITSAVEGDTHVTVYAPEIHDWKASKVFVDQHWVDAEWTWPPPTARRTGTEHTFLTTVYRHSDHRPLAGYRVRYRLIDGPPAVFAQTRGNEAVAITDLSGNAGVTLMQEQPRPGVNRVSVEIIRAPDPTASSGVGIVLGQGEAQVTWDGPVIGLNLDVSPTVPQGETVPVTLRVQNTGLVETKSLIVRTPIPEGLKYVKSDPPAVVEGNLLIWTLSELTAKQNKPLQVVFEPTRLGAINLQASVVSEEGVSAENKASTQITQPGLELVVSGPPTGAVGVPIPFQLTVSNPGTAAVNRVALRATMDQGLEAEAKANPIEMILDRPLGAGEKRVVPLALTARQGGTLGVRVEATAGKLKAQGEHKVNVQQAALTVKATGQGVRMVDSSATWELLVTNAGQVELRNVVLRNLLPEETDFTSASDGGQAQGREVVWNLGALKAGEQRKVQVTARPRTIAPKTLNRTRVSGDAEGLGASPGAIRAETEDALEIRGVPAFRVEVTDETDPLEVGKQTTYKIEVTNQGSLKGNQIEISAEIPAAFKLIGVRGAQYQVQGQRVVFAKRDGLEPKQTWTYEIRVEAQQPGDVRFKAELKAETLAAPVQKEQSTVIFR